MFGNLFSSFFGRNCSEIESDPRADMFEKELCRNMRQFEESFQEFSHFSPHEIFEMEEDDGRGQWRREEVEKKREDPQSLKDHILSPHKSFDNENKQEHFPGFHRGRRRFYHEEDKNLDDIIKNDPSQLERILKEPPTPSPRYSYDNDRDSPTVTRRSQSVIISTIRRPDGSVEHRKTVTDSDGNEETTVTTTPPTTSHDHMSRDSYIDPSYNRPSYFDKISKWLGIK